MSDLQLILTYRRCQSLRETGRLAGVSHVTVRTRLLAAEVLLGGPVLNRAKLRRQQWLPAEYA